MNFSTLFLHKSKKRECIVQNALPPKNYRSCSWRFGFLCCCACCAFCFCRRNSRTDGFLTLVNRIIWQKPHNCGFFYVKFIKF